MAKKLLLTLSLLICWQMSQVRAQSIAGGELYYELLSPKKYKITAHIYRLCELSPLNTVFGAVYGNAPSMQVSMTFTRTSIQKINDTCGNPCKVQNAFSTPGFERHTWEAIVDFNLPAYQIFKNNNICNVTFALRVSGRVVPTTHSSGLFFLDAGTNICDTLMKNNHSPVFTMEPKFLAPCNQALNYTPGPVDTFDYDSLGFAMAPIRSDFSSYLSYNTGYSGQIPITPYCPPNPNTTNCSPQPTANPPKGFFFDNNLCQMTFTPSKCTDKAYVKILVNEYRRNPLTKQMQLIGYVTREMLIQVKNVSGDNSVTLTANPSAFSLCTNNTLLTVRSKDLIASPVQSKADTTYMFWNGGYKLSSVQVIDTSREKSLNILLRKDSSLTQLKRQYFAVGAYDKRCNISLITKNFVATDYPLTRYKINKHISSCNVWTYNIINPDSGKTNDIRVGIKITDPSSKTVFSSARTADSFTFNTNGKHIIEYTLSNEPFICNKVIYDTVQVSNAFHRGMLIPGNDTMVCAPYLAKLKFQPSKSPGMVKLQWFRNDILFNSADSSIQMTLKDDSRFLLRLTDNRGCLAESHINYSIKRHNALLDFPTTECKYSHAVYTAIINTLTPPITYKWTLNGRDTLGPSDRSLDFIITDTSFITLTLKDSNNCEFSDSIPAYIIPTFTYKLQRNKPDICTDSLLTMMVGSITATSPYKVLWKISSTDSVTEDTTVTRRFKNNTTVSLVITDASTCVLRDSFVVKPIPLPKPALPTFSTLCEGDLVNINPSFNPNPYPKTFVWKINNKLIPNTDSFYSFRIREASAIYVKSTNKLGCFSEDSTSIQMHPKTVFNITGNTNYNQFKQVSLSTDQAFSSYQWFNNVFTRNNTFWAYELGTPGKHTVWCNVTDANGCNVGDTIDIFTDKFTGVDDIADSPVKLYPNPGRQILFIEVPDNCSMMLSNVEGKAIMTQELHGGLNSMNIDQLPAGLYVIRIGDRHIRWMKE